MKKIMMATVLAIMSYQTNASSVLYSGSVLASGSDTFSFSSLTPFSLTFDLLTPPLDIYNLAWSVKDNSTNNIVYGTNFNLFSNVSAVTPVIQAGNYGSSVSFNYPTSGVSVYYQVSISSVPIPAALYSFSSGLLGLLGIANKKKCSCG